MTLIAITELIFICKQLINGSIRCLSSSSIIPSLPLLPTLVTPIEKAYFINNK
jgi:hypothetical protein